MRKLYLYFAVPVLILGFFVGYIMHSDYDKKAIIAIVGEASNQDPFTMSCVAHAIRNRGNLKGVYGLTADHNWAEPPWVWSEAREVWIVSAIESDPVHGRKNFGTIDDLQHHPPRDKTVIYRCGDFFFY